MFLGVALKSSDCIAMVSKKVRNDSYMVACHKTFVLKLHDLF